MPPDAEDTSIPAAGDRLNEVLAEAEEALVQDFRTRGEVVLDDRWRLVFGMRTGDWCLFLEDTHNIDTNKKKPACADLMSANLQLRLLAAKQIPNLFDHLSQRQASRTRDANRTVEDLREFLAYRRKAPRSETP